MWNRIQGKKEAINFRAIFLKNTSKGNNKQKTDQWLSGASGDRGKGKLLSVRKSFEIIISKAKFSATQIVSKEVKTTIFARNLPFIHPKETIR